MPIQLVFRNMRIETSSDGVVSVYVEAKVNKRLSYRCPVCGKKCPGLIRSFWGFLLSFSVIQGYHIYPSVPWAYEDSRFTKDSDRTATWLAYRLSRKAVVEYLMIDWETVSRTRKDIEPDLKTRLDGRIDKTSYRMGHKYLTVISVFH